MHLIASVLLSAVLAAPASAEDSARDSDGSQVALSVAAFRNTPEDTYPDESEGWMIRMRSTTGHLHFGLEFSSQPEIAHAFDYKVPYGSVHEQRHFSLHSVGLALHLVPCPTCLISPYIGYAGALGWVRDHAPESPFYQTPEEYTRIGLGGPVAGLVLLPEGLFSMFVEVRDQSIIDGELTRERTVSVDMLGNVSTVEEEVSLKSRSAVVGVRINF